MNSNYIDALDLTLADSFVVPQNKVFSGNGEAKLYIGQRTSEHYRDFFGPTGFYLTCRLKKSDLVRFLEEMQIEYFRPSFDYRAKESLPSLWHERLKKVKQIETEDIYFEITEQTQIEGPRGYVNSSNPNYNFIRELPLPNTSRLKIVKLKEPSGFVYEFKLMPDFDGYTTKPLETQLQAEIESALEKVIQSEPLSVQTTIERVTRVRVGQQQFRKAVLADCASTCAFTQIKDEGLLIAGHIKPWAKSNDEEKLDPKNGLVFSPTYDRLFNNGLISFTENRALLVSPLLSKDTAAKLHLFPNMEIDIPLLGDRNKKRREYLEFHRNNTFRS